MFSEKRDIILSEGVSLLVEKDGTQFTTTALIGLDSQRSSTGVVYQRRGHFLPDSGVTSGCLITNEQANETYLALYAMNEIAQGEPISIMAKLVICNTTLRVSGIEETADKYGNIKRIPVIKVDGLKSYTTPITAELRQYNPGLHPDADYQVYAPFFEFDLLDQITLVGAGGELPVKVMATNYLTFSGVVVLDVSTETRK